MNYDRVDLKRTKAGPIVAVLFGVTVDGQSITVEAALIPEPIKRSIRVHFEKLQMQTPKNLTPGLYGPLFGSAVPSFEVING